MTSSGDRTVPSRSAFETGGLGSLPVFDGRLTWSGERLAADLRLRWWRELLNLVNEQTSSAAVEYALGGRYLFRFNDVFVPYGVAQLHSMSTPVFEYTNPARTTLGAQRIQSLGARVGIGGFAEYWRLFARVEFAETFIPQPSIHQFDSEFAVQVIDMLAIRVAYVAEARRFQKTFNTADVEIDDGLQFFTFGVTGTFP